jgi:hypothetical protein
MSTKPESYVYVIAFGDLAEDLAFVSLEQAREYAVSMVSKACVHGCQITPALKQISDTELYVRGHHTHPDKRWCPALKDTFEIIKMRLMDHESNDVTAELDVIKRTVDFLTANPEKLREVAKEAGILTEDGELTESFGGPKED